MRALAALLFGLLALPAFADCHAVPTEDDIAFYDAVLTQAVKQTASLPASANYLAHRIIGERRARFGLPDYTGGGMRADEQSLYDRLVLSALDRSAIAWANVAIDTVAETAERNAWEAASWRMQTRC